MYGCNAFSFVFPKCCELTLVYLVYGRIQSILNMIAHIRLIDIHVQPKHKHKEVHMSEINMSTRTYTGAVFPTFPLPSWVTVRVGLTTFICLSSSSDKKYLHFSCACAYVVPVHTYNITMQAQAQEEE